MSQNLNRKPLCVLSSGGGRRWDVRMIHPSTNLPAARKIGGIYVIPKSKIPVGWYYSFDTPLFSATSESRIALQLYNRNNKYSRAIHQNGAANV